MDHNGLKYTLKRWRGNKQTESCVLCATHSCIRLLISRESSPGTTHMRDMTMQTAHHIPVITGPSWGHTGPSRSVIGSRANHFFNNAGTQSQTPL